MEPETVQLRVHGDPTRPTLVYLPGIHGDWTLVGAFRQALGEQVRFVDTAYPLSVTWSLADHAAGLETALAGQGINHGWLLGESFGSQVAWEILARGRFQVDGVILAGGFVEHPVPWAVRLALWIDQAVPLCLQKRVLRVYAWLSRIRFRRTPEICQGLDAYVARYSELDRQVIRHRLQLVAENDPRLLVGSIRTPVYALSGVLDPIVPWCLARRALRRHCRTLQAFKIIWCADHFVLGTGIKMAAEMTVNWLGSS